MGIGREKALEMERDRRTAGCLIALYFTNTRIQNVDLETHTNMVLWCVLLTSVLIVAGSISHRNIEAARLGQPAGNRLGRTSVVFCRHRVSTINYLWEADSHTYHNH